MNYGVKYKKDFKYKDADNLEVIIDHNKVDLLTVVNIKKEWANVRIVIYVSNPQEFTEDDIKRYVDIFGKENIIFQFYHKHFDTSIKEMLESAEIPFFFTQPANTWDVMRGLVAMGASEIYVAEDMGFDLDNVSKYLVANNVRCRAYANVCQSSWADTDPLKTFFIRPEDIEEYSQYIDTIEFYNNKGDDFINTLYKIYAIDKKWFGDLSELIIGYDKELDSRALSPSFAYSRIGCKKKCINGNNHCRICDRLADLSAQMKEKKVFFNHKSSIDNQ